MELSERYSFLERLLHRLAFRTAPIQMELASVENRIFRRELEGIGNPKPVFITSLPRAGTTILLEILSRSGEFATHRYRDMPFVLLPLLWRRFAMRSRSVDPPVERAHGDGILVSLDSPEAFEEMLWCAWWPKHYCSDRIIPWGRCDDNEFATLLRTHMKKVIVLRRDGVPTVTRYLSKNNGNLARVGALLDISPDAVVLVPVREPEQHAASLLAQHRRFLEIHRRDAFARDYMKGIGHFDFGENLLPIDLDGWLGSRSLASAGTLAFWLEYWSVSFQHLMDRYRDRIFFLPYDEFCADPSRGLEHLGRWLGVEHPGRLCSMREEIRIPRHHVVEPDRADQALGERARSVYERVLQASDASGWDVGPGSRSRSR